MGSRLITLLWLWPATDHEQHCNTCPLTNLKVDWIFSTKWMMMQSYGWNLLRLQHLRNNNQHAKSLSSQSGQPAHYRVYGCRIVLCYSETPSIVVHTICIKHHVVTALTRHCTTWRLSKTGFWCFNFSFRFGNRIIVEFGMPRNIKTWD